MTALAGEIADGFLDHPATSPAWLEERLLPALDRGAARAGRPRPEVAAALICAVSDEDPAGARRAAAATVGFYATVRTYAEMFSEHGFAARLGGIRRAFLAGGGDALADAVGEEMTDAFAAAGGAAQVRERARAYEGPAQRLWACPPHHGQGPDETARWQRGILEAFGTTG
jgi:hypothetical protein